MLASIGSMPNNSDAICRHVDVVPTVCVSDIKCSMRLRGLVAVNIMFNEGIIISKQGVQCLMSKQVTHKQN